MTTKHLFLLGHSIQKAGLALVSIFFAGVLGSTNAVAAPGDIAPVITTQPLSNAVFIGNPVTITSAASGTPAPTFQWRKNGINLVGATGTSLSIASAQLADAGNYAMVATNSEGAATSRFSRLVVLSPKPNQITYTSTIFPTGVTVGGVVNLQYLLTNVGTKNWGTNHYLSIREPNGTFVGFAALIGVTPGENKTVNLSFTAPTTPGAYTYYVQALEGGVEFFDTQMTVTLNVLAKGLNSITYNTTNFAFGANPGSVLMFNYNVTNTGTRAWGANHYLAVRDGAGTPLTFVPMNGVAVGQSRTIYLSLTAPVTPGSYSYSVQAMEDGVEFFNGQANLSLTVLAPQPNAITYDPTRFPDGVMPGATVDLRYSVTNAGTGAWGPNHYLSLRDVNGTYLSFLSLGGIAPGSSKTLSFSFVAPTTPGIYTYYVQALENGVEFFDTQSIVTVNVLAASASNALSYSANTFPSAVVRGATVNTSYTITNRGTKTWDSNYYLTLRDADGNFLGFLSLAGTPPGATKTVSLSFTAPAAPGTYTYYLQGLESGITFFDSQETLVLSVQAAASDTEISRFLVQSTFGPNGTAIAQLRSTTYAAWVEEQLAMAPTYHLPYYKTRSAEFMARSGGTDNGYLTPRQEAWWQHAITAPDQLRQRMAFALSQILVISQDSSLEDDNEAVTVYYDILMRHAFGNYRQLLEEVTLSPMMGTYLSMIRNQKPDAKTGREPDENFAREIMQLFTIGLSELNLDGTLKLGADGSPIPTYSQADIVGLAHVFTGWGPYFDPANPPKYSNGTVAKANDWFLYGWDGIRPMTFNTNYGDLLARQIVGGVTVPGTLTGPQRLKLALDTLFNHPNVGPFLARQLIQRFVTSNPSPDYIRRVASAFNSSGTGVRGDLGATIRAVLLDPEARSVATLTNPKFGKLTEPLLRMTRLFRAFPPTPRPYASVGDNRLFLNYVYSMDEQAPLFSPTVFNFYKPGFAKAGSIVAAGMVSPEFQIFDDVTAMLETNRNYNLIFSNIYVGEPVATGTNMKIDLAEPLAILNAPGRTHAEAQAALVDYFDQRLMGGTMSPFLRQKILDTYTSLPASYTYTAANELRRVQVGLYLVMFSPEFNVQR